MMPITQDLPDHYCKKIKSRKTFPAMMDQYKLSKAGAYRYLEGQTKNFKD